MATETQLKKAATLALRDYMGLANEETLLIVSDEGKREIGLALLEAGKKLAGEAFYVEMKARNNHGEEPPDTIAEMMKAVDVVVCPTTKSITHTNARRAASKLGVRVGTMPGIEIETMVRCLNADYEKIIELTHKVADSLKDASIIRVETKLGTDITMPVKNRRIISSTGVMRNIGESGNLPSGEVYLAPEEGQSNGVIYFDGSIGGVGLIKNPVKVNIKDGSATKFSSNDEGKELSRMLRNVGQEALAIGEFGIGTNYKATLCGKILEDEKVLGTIHIAFGNNRTMGGSINVPIHIDGIVKKPTVYVDNKIILKDGEIVI